VHRTVNFKNRGRGGGGGGGPTGCSDNRGARPSAALGFRVSAGYFPIRCRVFRCFRGRRNLGNPRELFASLPVAPPPPPAPHQLRRWRAAFWPGQDPIGSGCGPTGSTEPILRESWCGMVEWFCRPLTTIRYDREAPTSECTCPTFPHPPQSLQGPMIRSRLAMIFVVRSLRTRLQLVHRLRRRAVAEWTVIYRASTQRPK